MHVFLFVLLPALEAGIVASLPTGESMSCLRA